MKVKRIGKANAAKIDPGSVPSHPEEVAKRPKRGIAPERVFLKTCSKANFKLWVSA